MVTEKQLQNLGFDQIEEYFDYIVESKVNGQRMLALEFYDALSMGMKGQRADFMNYVETTYFYDMEGDVDSSELREFKNFFS